MLPANLPFLFAQNAGGAADGGLLTMGIVLTACGLVGFVLWLWVLVDAIRNPALTGTARLLWILLIVFTGVIGAILYVLIARPQLRTQKQAH